VDTSIHVIAYERLKRHLGIATDAEPRVMHRMMQAVEVDEAILQHLDVDTRCVIAGRPDHSRAREIDDRTYQDEWGVVRRKPPGGYWYDQENGPLAGEITISDIVNYPWPDPHDPGYVRDILPRIERLRRTTDCALVLGVPSAFVHVSQYVRGFEDWFIDAARDQRLLCALFDAVLEVNMALAGEILQTAGHLVDVVMTADDIGAQHGPIVSPQAYRTLIKPRQRAYFEFIRERTPAPILYHSCGSLYVILKDLIEIGVQALTPVQVTARGMQTDRLKEEFGDRVAFWGAVDTQGVLPFGTVEDVRAEVRRRVRDLAPGGGYVLSAVHNIQPEVPPENICAMFEAARIAGVRDSIEEV
jgi:uroporphyrinogen decarboxylase